jgi:hypothetical protein
MSEDNDGDNDNSNYDDNTETGPIGSTNIPEDDNDDYTETGSIGSTDTQEDPTPRLALKELIAASSRLPPENDNTDILEDDNDDNTIRKHRKLRYHDRHHERLQKSHRDYPTRQRRTSKSLQRKEKELRRHRKILRSPRQRPLKATMLWTSWLLFLASRHRRRLHLQGWGNNTIYSPVHAQRTTIANRTLKIRINQRIQMIHNRPTKV